MMEDVRRIVIKGIPPYDGEYPLDDRGFNTREWNWIKRVSGYMPFTVHEGQAGGDPALYVALAVIAMARAGKIDRTDGVRVADDLAEAPFDDAHITMIVPDDEEEPEVPLELTSEPATSSDSNSLETPSTSGPHSRPTTGQSEKTPVSIGTLESATLPMSDRSRLVS
jgi:hypothetical protein